MVMNMNVRIETNGGIFTKNMRRVVEEAVGAEIITKIEERTRRGGRGLAAQRNTITHERHADNELQIVSTAIWPRVTGRAWAGKNIGIIRAMAPRVARRTVERIAAELGS